MVFNYMIWYIDATLSLNKSLFGDYVEYSYAIVLAKQDAIVKPALVTTSVKQ